MYRQIAVVIDESPEAERALASAISLARSAGSHLHIVTSVKSPAAYTAYATVLDPAVARVLEEDYADWYSILQTKALHIAQAAGVAVTGHLLQGNETDNVVVLLRAQRADLLVLGLHRKSSVVSRLWNNVFKLAQDAPCSVLGVH